MDAALPRPVRGRRRPCEIEVRQLYELEDFPPSETLDRFKELEAAKQA